MSDFVFHFGENFMKISQKKNKKKTKLQLITFRFVIGFDELLETKFKIFLIVLKCNFHASE